MLLFFDQMRHRPSKACQGNSDFLRRYFVTANPFSYRPNQHRQPIFFFNQRQIKWPIEKIGQKLVADRDIHEISFRISG